LRRTLTFCRYGTFAVLVASSILPVLGQQLSDSAVQQMKDLLSVKRSLTRGQRKMSSALIFGAMKARNQSVGTAPNTLFKSFETDSQGLVVVDLKARSLPSVLKQITTVGGQVVYASQHDGAVRAALPPLSIEAVADLSDVQWVRSAARARTNGMATSLDSWASPTVPLHLVREQRRKLVEQQIQQSLPLLASHGYHPSFHSPFRPLHLAPFIGAVTSQGYITHTANQAVQLGIDGTGVKVGVLSDSALPARVAALMASGDLPADVTILPGQAGPGDGSDEGTAMMEIVHDLAPGAKLFFATAFTSASSFADNIRTLRFTYGCDMIVDDVSYFDEGVFQDSTVAQAVNDVTADGALYFSSAANSGNLTNRTSGTWEGDFKEGGDAGALIDFVEGVPVRIHDFSASGTPQLYNTLTLTSPFFGLQWSDPLGASSNDYDFFVLNSTGTTIRAFSIDTQSGTQDPFEHIEQGTNCGTASAAGYCPAVGDRLVVVLYNGSPRALHIDTERGELAIGTSGATFGHNAGVNTVSMAATAWSSAHNGTRPFTGFANPIETFSSDGPRKIFYNPEGSAITPGNYLFATNGGTTLQKPDLTAADGVFTKTPGFLPFFGTSAAAPHAAAIAALVKSAHPSLTNVQIKNILTSTALDTMAPGVDRDSGYGITMALPAVQAAVNY